VTWMFQ